MTKTTTNTADVINSIRLNTMNEAVEMAIEVKEMEDALKFMKAEMRRFVQDNQTPIETDDTIWDINSSESWKFTSAQMKDIATNIAVDGKDPWELLTITSANLRKLEWDDKFLATIGERKTTERFGSRKK